MKILLYFDNLVLNWFQCVKKARFSRNYFLFYDIYFDCIQITLIENLKIYSNYAKFHQKLSSHYE